MKIDPKRLRLYAVTDRAWTHDAEGLLRQVAAAVDGGAGIVQLREKHMGQADFLAEAERFVALCREKGAVSIINHNVETPPAHYSRIRPQADYQQSLELLRRVKEAGRVSKSGLMVGLGETDEEVHGVLADLAAAGCDIVTIGQYMRPSQKHHPVERYVHPDIFESYAQKGRELGIPFVFSAPLVRSSYNAEQAYASLLNRQQHMPSEAAEPRGSEQP
mgnify:CR=1 FL=1